MAAMSSNAVLLKAKSLCQQDTPDKKIKPELKDEKPDLTPSPPSAKKPCTAFEKFMKTLPGDTQVVKESWAISFRVDVSVLG